MGRTVNECLYVMNKMLHCLIKRQISWYFTLEVTIIKGPYGHSAMEYFA